MTFPTLNQETMSPFTDAWFSMRVIAWNMKGNAIDLRDRSAISNVTTMDVLSFVGEIRSWRTTMVNNLDPAQGLLDYAQQQVGDSTDLAADFAAILAQIEVTLAAIVAVFPVDTDGWMLARRWDPNDVGRLSDRPIDSADLANVRTELNALIALFD